VADCHLDRVADGDRNSVAHHNRHAVANCHAQAAPTSHGDSYIGTKSDSNGDRYTWSGHHTDSHRDSNGYCNLDANGYAVTNTDANFIFHADYNAN